jgi:DNA-binding IclR family transcriptional regulator
VLNSKLLKVAEAFMELEKRTTPVNRCDLTGLLLERYGMTRRTVALLLRTLLEEGFITELSSGRYKRRELGKDHGY